MILTRRGFLGALAGAAATLVVPRKKAVSYFFGMGLPDWDDVPVYPDWQAPYKTELRAMERYLADRRRSAMELSVIADHERRELAFSDAAIRYEFAAQRRDSLREVQRLFEHAVRIG